MSKVLEYFNGDGLAANVWQAKYMLEGEETPDDMHRRLAKEFARIEKIYNKDEAEDIIIGVDFKSKLSEYGYNRKPLTEESIYNLLKDFKYIVPQGSVMSGLGSGKAVSLSNCFVVGEVTDSYGGIMKTDEEMAQLMKRRGGVGIDISKLRPENTPTNNAAKTSTGAISFMKRFSDTTREISQAGRRGALMISIDVKHPDILDFIKVKRNTTDVTGANISIKLNKEFMKAVENDEDYVLRFPVNMYEKYNSYEIDEISKLESVPYNVLFPFKVEKETKGYTKKIKAKELWDEIIKSAHGYAEPGLIFEDNHHNYSPDGVYEQYKGVTTNPCGR